MARQRPRVTSVGLILPPRPPADFSYPSHIERAGIDALPDKPGVYLFRDQRGSPVYIGKSINIRSRVLAHLRTAEEAAMLHDTASIDFVRCAGEIGALLLESHLIKQLQPVYNCRLRTIPERFALHLSTDSAQPSVVGSHQQDIADGNACYGLFPSRHAAEEGLRALLRRHRLCPALCGLETTVKGRACFSSQLGYCAGACVGKESPQVHRVRLLAALRQMEESVWPYPGALGIIEEDEGWRQIHVVDRWAYLGSFERKPRKIRRPRLLTVDMDIYRILAKPLFTEELNFVIM